jgi:hypothetical protein
MRRFIAAVFMALPVIRAKRLLTFAINFIDGESFPVQKSGGMISPPMKHSSGTSFTLGRWY